MVLGPPRSGTTWAANWLTTDTTLCLHDPLYARHYSELDSIKSRKRLGISCTGLAAFFEWVDRHPARKLILVRDEDEVNAACAEIGLPPVPHFFFENLSAISGQHVHWRNLFEDPEPIWKYLIGNGFDLERHSVLKEMYIQPDFQQLTVNREATRKLLTEFQQIMRH